MTKPILEPAWLNRGTYKEAAIAASPLLAYVFAQALCKHERKLSWVQADVVFFMVSARPQADMSTLRDLVFEQQKKTVSQLNVLDGKYHSYLDVVDWIGSSCSKRAALTLIGLGAVLGLWQLDTLANLGPRVPRYKVVDLAFDGYVNLKYEPNFFDRPWAHNTHYAILQSGCMLTNVNS